MQIQKRESGLFIGYATVTKYAPPWTEEDVLSGRAIPYDLVRSGPNALQYLGASAFWEFLLGNTPDLPFSTNSAIGVGDGGGGVDKTLQDLTGTKFRKQVAGGYPLHTPSNTAATEETFWRAIFTGAQANFHWREWAIFNNTSGGLMLNRKVEDLGLKKSGETWQFDIKTTLTSS